MASVEEINDLEDLAGLRLLWKSLLPGTAGATFFHTLDWLEVYWRHFGREQKLRTLVVLAAGKPIGILPLVVRKERTRVGPVRVLTYPLHDWGTFYGPIGPNPTATLLASLKHVHNTRRDWDLLDLRWVDKAGHDRGRTPRAMQAAGFRPHEQACGPAAVIEMSGTWEQYWSSRPKKWREKVDRLERRLADRADVTYIRYRPEGEAHGDGDPRWDLYDASVEVAEKSWQGSSTTGTTLSHASVREYLRETHAAAAKCGSVDLNLLLVNGDPAALAYNYHHQGRIYGLRVGYDPRWAALRPGTLLQQMILRDSFERGDEFYDLGVGSLECKRSWQTSLVASFRYTHFPIAVPRAQLLRVKRWFRDRYSRSSSCSTKASPASSR